MDPLRVLEKINTELSELRKEIEDTDCQIHDLSNAIKEKELIIQNLRDEKKHYPEQPLKVDFTHLGYGLPYENLFLDALKTGYRIERQKLITSLDFRISEADTLLRQLTQEKEANATKLPRLKKREQKLKDRIQKAVTNARNEMERITQRHGEAINQAS